MTDPLHTPATLLNRFSDQLQLHQLPDPLVIRGLYQAEGKRPYGSYFYDLCQEETSDQHLTLKVPHRIRANLHTGNLYLFRGHLDQRIKPDSTINVIFVVTECLSEETPKPSPADERRAELLHRRANQGHRELDPLLREQLQAQTQPRILMIFGTTAITDQDVKTAAGFAWKRYQIIEHRIPLTSKTEILEQLHHIEAGGLEAVALVRGGGSGLEIFNDPDIGEQILSMPVPVISAIGHAQDVTLVEQLADKAFPTPTALGTYLKDLVKTSRSSAPRPHPHHRPDPPRPLRQQLEQIIQERDALAELLSQSDRVEDELRSVQQQLAQANRENQSLRNQITQTGGQLRIKMIAVGIGSLVVGVVLGVLIMML